MCDQCAALAQQLAARERELAHARREIEQLKRRVLRLRQIIHTAAGTCARCIHEAEQVLGRRSGVAPRIWGHAKGQRETAAAILLVLGQPE